MTHASEHVDSIDTHALCPGNDAQARIVRLSASECIPPSKLDAAHANVLAEIDARYRLYREYCDAWM